MTGKVLQERIAAVSNIPFNTIAERIGVSSQSMYQFFTAKDVKSGLIEKVCEVLNIDVATSTDRNQYRVSITTLEMSSRVTM